jgi:hypothetical protein
VGTALDELTDTSVTLGPKTPRPDHERDQADWWQAISDAVRRAASALPDMAVTPGRLLERAQKRTLAAHEIQSFGGLPANWDRQGAEPISAVTAARGVTVLRYLARRALEDHGDLPAPLVAPTPGGSVHLQWNLDGAYVSVECPPPDKDLSYYVETPDRELESDAASLDEIWDAVRAVFD